MEVRLHGARVREAGLGDSGARENSHLPRVFHDTKTTWEKSPYWDRHSGLC